MVHVPLESLLLITSIVSSTAFVVNPSGHTLHTRTFNRIRTSISHARLKVM